MISICYLNVLLTDGDMIEVTGYETWKIILLWSLLIIYMYCRFWSFFHDMGSVIQKELVFQTLKCWRITPPRWWWWWGGGMDTKTTHTFVIYSWKWMGFSFAYALLRCANGKQWWRLDKLANLKHFPKTRVYHLIVLD